HSRSCYAIFSTLFPYTSLFRSRDLEQEGSILQSSSDTEVLAHLIRKNGHLQMEEAIVAGLNQLVGAYAFIILTENSMYVALDPRDRKSTRLNSSHVSIPYAVLC